MGNLNYLLKKCKFAEYEEEKVIAEEKFEQDVKIYNENKKNAYCSGLFLAPQRESRKCTRRRTSERSEGSVRSNTANDHAKKRQEYPRQSTPERHDESSFCKWLENWEQDMSKTWV